MAIEKKFHQGQIINANELNAIDSLIQQLEYDSSKLNDLIEFWKSHFNSHEPDNLITDEIEDIKETIEELIKAET